MKIEKGYYCNTEVLKHCGWKFHHGVGPEFQVWVQASEVLIYNPITGEVKMIMPKNVAL